MGETKKLARRSQLTTGGPCWVYVDEEENKIVRVTPIDLTDEDSPSWEIEAHGRTFRPPRKSTMTPVTARPMSGFSVECDVLKSPSN